MELTKEYVITTLQEERLWKAGESDSFKFKNMELTLEKEEVNYKPYVYSVKGVNNVNGSSISRRYTSMENAFLHILNNFNENANLKNRYNTINDFILDK